MQTIQGALRTAMPNLDKIARQQRFQRAVERGQAIVAKVDSIAGRDAAGAILLLKQNRYDCAACLAVMKQNELQDRRKRSVFVPALTPRNGQGLSGEKLVDELIQLLEGQVAKEAPVRLELVG